VRRKRLSGITAIILLIITVVAGCGGTALVGTTLIPPSTTTTTTATASNASSDKYASARYCQRLDDGDWVTNDSAYSATPCVPDPSYATGNEQADGYGATPRCFACSLSDWERAEKRAKARNGGQPQTFGTDTTAADSTSSGGLPAAAGGSFVKACAQNADGGFCACVAGHVAKQVPRYQMGALTADDPRVQAALESCAP
jgi:hypothetical protein